MEVQTGGSSSIAQASVSAGLTLDDSSGNLVMSWQPDGTTGNGSSPNLTVNAGSVSGVMDPFSLNASIVCNFDGCDKVYQNESASDAYSITYKAPNVDETLSGLFFMVEAAQAQVPEPASFAIFGAALAALGVVRRLWRRATR